jgi:Fe2+ transport system protein FeoA
MTTEMIKLTSVEKMVDYRVIGISDLAPHELKIRLCSHGLTPGSILKLVRSGSWTPILIELRGGLLAISGQEAQYIEVSQFLS